MMMMLAKELFSRGAIVSNTRMFSQRHMNRVILPQTSSTRLFSTSEIKTREEEIGGLKSFQELETYMQSEGNSLKKEHLVMVLEQITNMKKADSSNSIPLLRDQCLKAIFQTSLSELPPLYVASLMDSMTKLQDSTEEIQSEHKKYWRHIEGLLSRKQFFSTLTDLGLISILLSKYSGMPYQLSELELEEAFMEAEAQCQTLMQDMIKQKKLAEDVGFHGNDLALLMESFSQSLFGYTSLFETCQNLALKFKYALSGDNLVKILHSTVIAKYPLNQDLINLLASVNRNELDSPVIQHQYDFITASLKLETISKEDKGYVDHRNELNTRVMPFIPNTKSYKVLLKEGETYFWCTCGLSKNQPFCDGAHKDLPPYKPLKFTYTEEDKIRGLCGCKMNQVEKGPFCDGSHKTIDFSKVQERLIKPTDI